MKFIYKKVYLKTFDRYTADEQSLIIATDTEIREYYVNRTAPYGLRIKKLYDNGQEKVYEARVADKIRILWVEASSDLVAFAFLGSHDAVRKYIKSLR